MAQIINESLYTFPIEPKYVIAYFVLLATLLSAAFLGLVWWYFGDR